MSANVPISGWCAHGVPYGPNWRCALCGSPPGTTYSTETPPVLDPELARRLDRIIHLLEVLTGNRR